uniref:Uncharacterized protein n=1 Tax=Lepeophtheirus salmonis TaxID=72036 RepID=A0A0K2SZM1_LEPSM
MICQSYIWAVNNFRGEAIKGLNKCLSELLGHCTVEDEIDGRIYESHCVHHIS